MLPPPVKKRKLNAEDGAAIVAASHESQTSPPSFTIEFGCYCGQLDPPEFSSGDKKPLEGSNVSGSSATISVLISGRLPLTPAAENYQTQVRVLQRNDVRCEGCGLFFHVSCLQVAPKTLAPLPGDNGYVFVCRRCQLVREAAVAHVPASASAVVDTTRATTPVGAVPPSLEPAEQTLELTGVLTTAEMATPLPPPPLDSLQLTDRPWMESLRVVFFNLRLVHPERVFFHIKDEIVPFIDKNWELICIARAKASTWPNTITSTMSINHAFFRNGNSVMGGSGWWGCLPTESPLITRLTALHSQSEDKSRLLGPHLEKSHTLLSADALAKKLKKAAQRVSHESALYLAPPPASAAERALPSGPSAAKALSDSPVSPKPVVPKRAKLTSAVVPGTSDSATVRDSVVPAALVLPVLGSPTTYAPSPTASGVVFLRENSADQIFIDKSGLFVRNGKGYCSARTSFPAVEGAWYFEATVSYADPRDSSHLMDKTNRQWPKPAHWRIGWAVGKGDVQAPPGADSYSYGWRDLDGAVFHEGKHRAYSEPYSPEDVLGFLIDLPHRPVSDPSLASAPLLEHSGRITFFKNGVSQGVAFEGLYGCRPTDTATFLGFYPCVSAYYNGCVSLNFGPDFRCPPDVGESAWRPCHQLAEAYHAYREVHLKPAPSPEAAPIAAVVADSAAPQASETPPDPPATLAPLAEDFPISLSSDQMEGIVLLSNHEHLTQSTAAPTPLSPKLL